MKEFGEVDFCVMVMALAAQGSPDVLRQEQDCVCVELAQVPFGVQVEASVRGRRAGTDVLHPRVIEPVAVPRP